MGYSAPHGLRPDEVQAAVALVNSVFRPEKKSMQGEFPLLFSGENAENLRVITCGEEPVSHIGIYIHDLSIYGHQLPLASIGSVCTASAHRGSGLATTLLRDVEDYLCSRSVPVMLVSGQRGLYTRNGCTRFGRVVRFRLARELETHEGECFEVDEIAAGELSDRLLGKLLSMYKGEPVRFIRSFHQFRIRMQAQLEVRILFGDPHLFLVTAGGEPVAYLLVFLNREDSRVTVFEYAGLRPAVFAALGLIRSALGAEVLELMVPFQDRSLLLFFRNLGLFGSEECLWAHTLKVLDFKRLFSCLADYFVGFPVPGGIECGEEFSLVIRDGEGSSEYRYPSRDLMQASLFGRGEKRLPALEGREDGMTSLLAGALPLPTVMPGIDYV